MFLVSDKFLLYVYFTEFCHFLYKEATKYIFKLEYWLQLCNY